MTGYSTMKKGILILGVMWICGLSTNGEVFTEDQKHDIENFVNEVIACRHIPGMTVSVIRGNDSWSRGFGLADMETGRRVDNSTEFQIGSLTKAMTTTLLGILLQEKGHNWNTKLQDLPGGEIYQFPPEIPSWNVTLSDLLTHRTGLSGLVDEAFFAGYPAGTEAEDIVRKIKLNPVVDGFREKFGYNNYMYMVLGYVCETLGGDSWGNLIKSHIFEPIGLTDTSILESDDDVYRDNSAKPYIFRDEQLQPGTKGILKITPFEAAGSVMSTGKDMIKWMRFNLNNGKTDSGEQLIDPDFLGQAYQEEFKFSPGTSGEISYKTPTYPADDITSGYGFAWFIGSYRGHRKVWHSGGLFSYVSYLWLYPEEGIGMFASVNGPAIPSVSGRSMKSLFWYITDLLLGYEPWIAYNTACTFEAPWVNKTVSNRPPHEIYTNTNTSRFIGSYVSDLFPEVKVSRGNDQVNNGLLRFEMSRMKGFLYPAENEGVIFGFELTEPWEWAIENVKNENYTERYPVKFITSNSNGTSEDRVVGMNVIFRTNAVMQFVKVLQADDPTAGGICSRKTLPGLFLVCFCFSLFVPLF